MAAVAIVALSSCKTQYEILLQSNDADAKYNKFIFFHGIILLSLIIIAYNIYTFNNFNV